MDEFKKIDLGPAVDTRMDPNSSSDSSSEGMARSRKKFPKFLKITLGAILVLILISVPLIVFPAIKVYNSALKTQAQAKKVWDAAKTQNVTLAKEELVKTKKSLAETQKDLNALGFVHFIPILAWYYNDTDHILKAMNHGLDAAGVLVDAIEPYVDVLGLKGKGSFVMGSAEERIKVAVQTMGKITPRIDDISTSLVLAQKEIDQVNPNHYPPIFGGKKVRDQLITAKKVADEGFVLVDQARPLIKILPSLLGESKEKKYLVIFQNDKEIRPTGGFMTAYAIFRLDKGIIHVDRASDMYTLDKSLLKRGKAPRLISEYLPKVSTFNLRDSNLSPDFINSMDTFNSLYQDASDKVDVDGIIALDTNVLVSTIKILDDEVYGGGERFTSQIDKNCNCPQAVYLLERLTDQPLSIDIRVTSLAAVQAARKDIIGVLMYAIMEKALKSSPKKYWGPLIQDLIKQTNEKHVLFYLFDKKAQGGLEALNAAGRIKKFDGDYLHINDANFGGAKSNLFVKEAVSQSIDVGSDGSITKTIVIDYRNPFAPSNCNEEQGGLCLNATLRDVIRVYVPKGSVLLDSQGSEVKVTSYEELDKTVFEGFLTVRPLGKATYTLKYKLPFKVANSHLPLLIQKQPGTDSQEYTVKVKGREVDKFLLQTDKELNLTL